MIFNEKDDERYNIGQNFFVKKHSKDLCRKAVAFFLRYFMPEKNQAVSTAPHLFQHELPLKFMQSIRNFKVYSVLAPFPVSSYIAQFNTFIEFMPFATDEYWLKSRKKRVSALTGAFSGLY